MSYTCILTWSIDCHCSKNSLDDNAIEPASIKKYDEQEITLDLYNDEIDSHGKIEPPEYRTGSYLNAAIAEHDILKKENDSANNNYNEADMFTGNVTYGTSPLAELETTEI